MTDVFTFKKGVFQIEASVFYNERKTYYKHQLVPATWTGHTFVHLLLELGDLVVASNMEKQNSWQCAFVNLLVVILITTRPLRTQTAYAPFRRRSIIFSPYKGKKKN